jgi:3,4-dihydroxy 2-butanone 4-phosphate synthase
MHLKFKEAKVPTVPEIEHLKKLALIGAINKTIKVSSNEFQKHTGASSKTAARKLKQMEEEGLIERKIVPGGQLITMTEKGIEILKSEYMEYSSIFSPESDTLELEGNVLKGLGEGQYYVSIPGYKKQFEEKLHFIPFPGTLNVKLTENSLALRHRLLELAAVQIEGFNDGERTFGGGKCYPVNIGGVEAAVVSPERTHYPSDLIEIIAPVKLRDALSLKDGDRVVIQVKKGEKRDGEPGMSGSIVYDCLTYRNENINRALEALRAGKMIQIYDSDSREGETDLVIPAKAVTYRDVKWMRKDAGGLICVAVDPVAAEQLKLPFMADLVREASKKSDTLGEVVEKEGDLKYDSHSSFSLWVNHRNTRTGIPDYERALTIQKIGEITEKNLSGARVHFGDEFRTPGHVALLRAAEGLLDDRKGQTELSVALARMAGITPAMVVCEMLDDENGKALSKEKAKEYGKDNGLVFLEGQEIIEAYTTWTADE